MRPLFFLCPMVAFVVSAALAAEPEFPLTADSKPQPDVPQGTLIEGSYTARAESLFPGTERPYHIYLPPGHDKAKPAPFMVFQDGIIYQAPVVFDNLIAKKDVPPLVGIFIKPGVVPAVSENALPRFNRSYEYDSVTDTYARFLIEEFLPDIEAAHGIRLTTDPNQAAIAGNSSGGICAFMAAWHRPDRFRRVFTGVGTYVGIRGADQLPVLLRKLEPRPLRVFLQSGTGDNNLYCGDWWMANQMMQRSLAWAGYDVEHAWGEGGHNQKHASQIFPDAMRWLWRDWQTDIEIKANPKGESKWRGYEVLAGEKGWAKVYSDPGQSQWHEFEQMAATADGSVWIQGGSRDDASTLIRISPGGDVEFVEVAVPNIDAFTAAPGGALRVFARAIGRNETGKLLRVTPAGEVIDVLPVPPPGPKLGSPFPRNFCCDHDGRVFYSDRGDALIGWFPANGGNIRYQHGQDFSARTPSVLFESSHALCLSPDQTQLYAGQRGQISVFRLGPDPMQLQRDQMFYLLEWLPWLRDSDRYNQVSAMCVDTDGRLYAATSAGIQVCDQAGRVNFILPTPQEPQNLCFGGKDLSELFAACGPNIYKREMRVRGVVSGQQPPVKPAPPKL